MANTILIKHSDGGGVQKESVASEAIMPGHHVERIAGGDLKTDGGRVQLHSTAAGWPTKAFALEMDLIGRGVDDGYAAGETVKWRFFAAGEEVQARLAAGETVTVGTQLASNGAGALAAASGGTGAFCVALEDVDNSASSDEAWIRVEVV